MSRKRVLFVNHKKAKCGVYEFGKNVASTLLLSRKYEFIYVECENLKELKAKIEINHPDVIIYNYNPSTMTWITTKLFPRLYINNTLYFNKIPQIGIIHEVTQEVADSATNYYRKFLVFGKAGCFINSLFDYYIAADPTLLLKNPIVFKTGRLIPKYEEKTYGADDIPIIGSFGFGTPKKGFEEIVQLVQSEFNEAIIRFNIPPADFGDDNGVNALAIADRCRSLITKQGIKIYITHTFLSNEDLLNFLAKNTINVFLYESQSNRGISSVIDYALAVGKPIVVSDSTMFRHIFSANPSIRISQNNLKTIIKNGTVPLQRYLLEWNEKNLIWDYERIIDGVISNEPQGETSFFGSIMRFILKGIYYKAHSWIRTTERLYEDNYKDIDLSIKYSPLVLPQNFSFNGVLDDHMRTLYQPTVDALFQLVPRTMSKKIPRANINQAFVFDSVFRFLKDYKNPKILCVGSYEDTASMSLTKMGYEIEEIDPVVNYSLQAFYTKPTTKLNSYDIIFSTSVIEHDPDDESFVRCISGLLAPGGLFVMTCDYKDGWQVGDEKPDVNARLYTQEDLKNRLLSVMGGCSFIDGPQWNCENPDFFYLNRFRYTFATFVVRKNIL